MQRETQKEWWQLKTLPPSLDISQHNRNLDEIGRYIILILKNPFKDKKKKCSTTSFFYIDVCLEESFKKIEDVLSNVANPLIVREKIAKRFGLKVEFYDEWRIARSYASTPASAPSTPVLEGFIVTTSDDEFEIKYTTTRTTAT